MIFAIFWRRATYCSFKTTFPIIYEVEMKKEIAVVFGGKSCEHDISVITALYVYNALNAQKYNKHAVYLRDGQFYSGKKLEELESYIDFKENSFKKVIFNNGCMKYVNKPFKAGIKIDCALLCAHGGEGENGALQGYFEVCGIPYTSCGVLASGLCMDKVMCKYMLKALGYNILPYVALHKGQQQSFEKIAEKCGLPFIIKPARLGSSIGISIANDKKQAEEGFKLAFEYDNKVLVEKCLKNFIEINCAAMRFENEIVAGLPERPLSDNAFLSYEDKYINYVKYQPKREYPAKISKEKTLEIQRLTKRLYEDFEMSGVVRIDYLIDGEEIYVNEINTIPGSLAHYLFTKQGITSAKLLDNIINQSIKEKAEKDKLISSFCSNVLAHYKGSKNAPPMLNK